MPLQHFPKPLPDELLGSLLARCVRQLGIKDDKVALQLLFGSRNVVPSALMQGHVDDLLRHVGHLWTVSSDEVLSHHSILPLFRPFLRPSQYSRLVDDLRCGQKNHGMLRSGINASSLRWPESFRVCVLCWREQQKRYGFGAWMRLFHCAGIECCPLHHCYLFDTGVPLTALQRHRFVDSSMVSEVPAVTEAASLVQIRLACAVQELLNNPYAYVEPGRWELYYQSLVRELGLLDGKRIRHDEIRRRVLSCWGVNWLERVGIFRSGESNWLRALFRKHRRPFNYLQHLVAILALDSEFSNIEQLFGRLNQLPNSVLQPGSVRSSVGISYERREQWLSLVNCPSVTLKDLRATQEGARLYSWLYRFDGAWLQIHKPRPMARKRLSKVDWVARDKQAVRELLRLEHSLHFELNGPRRSVAWYMRQSCFCSDLQKKLHLLPLCQAFLSRYAESVDEFQTRRIAAVLVGFLDDGRRDIKRHEVERACGLSEQRCREPARQILRNEIAHWSGIEEISCQHQA